MESYGTKKEAWFVDILEERRMQSDISWASRVWDPVRAYIQPYKYNSEEIKSVVQRSYRLMKTLHQISKVKQVPLDVLYHEAQNILKEIGYKREVSILRWLALIVSKILKKLCSAVYVNEAKFLEIKSHMGSNPVLFIPSHKSYCDFILMSYVCFHYEVDIPRIAAGMDFHSMAVVGNILRDACAFFIRRSFTQDEIYSAVFSQYVQTLVTHGDAAIEFFIEGTRSRTSKSLMPKYGFLAMALKPFFTGLVPDVTIIPVNISYDRVLEELLFAYELLGVPKPKESTRGFLKALSILNENYGNMYVQFGDSFSVKEYFGDEIDRSVHGFGSVQVQDLTLEESKYINNLAHTIVRKQKESTVLTGFNLIATMLNENFIQQIKPHVIGDLILDIEWLFSVLKVLTPNMYSLPLDVIDKDFILHHLSIHKSLVFVSNGEVIQIHRTHSSNSVVDPNKLKGHNLSENIRDIAIPFLMLQYYVNPCSSFLVGVCFMVLIVQSLASKCVISLDELFREFKFLCSIFSYEFVFHNEFIQKDFDEALKHSQQLKVVFVTENNQVKKGENKKLSSFCINFLSSWIPGYITVTEFLLESGGSLFVEKEVLKDCQKIVESKLASGTILHPANLSLDMLSNAFQAFVAMKAVNKVKGTSGIEYRVEGTLREIHSKLILFDHSNKFNPNMIQKFSAFIKSSL